MLFEDEWRQKYREICFGVRIISVLFDYTMGFFEKLRLRIGQPPISQISIQIVLTALIVKSMRYFVPNDLTYCPVIEIARVLGREKFSLQNSSRNLCG